MTQSNPTSSERRRSSRFTKQASPSAITPQLSPASVAAPPSDVSATSDAGFPPEVASSSVTSSAKEKQQGDERSATSLKRKSEFSEQSNPFEEAWKPVTDDDRKNWKGWADLESEPWFFNFLLQKYGVQGVDVQEVIGLDEDSLAMLPNPIYGLIFLFAYRDIDGQDSPGAVECPEHVWFANQTTDNACATIALMNIAMNVPEVALGDELKAFKEETQSLTSPRRGQALGDNAFIRGIHNSFLRRSDILNSDLYLQGAFQKWERARKAFRQMGNRKSNKKQRLINNDDDSNSAYHFIAYVPAGGDVWKLDGMQRNPTNLGPLGDDWISIAKDNIVQRIGRFEDIDYSLLSVTKCPLRHVLDEVALNLSSISQVEGHLNKLIPDWKAFLDTKTLGPVEELRQPFGLCADALISSSSIQEKIDSLVSDPGALMRLYEELAREHARLSAEYMNVIASTSEMKEKAMERKRDDAPLIGQAIKALAESGVLRNIVQQMKGT